MLANHPLMAFLLNAFGLTFLVLAVIDWMSAKLLEKKFIFDWDFNLVKTNSGYKDRVAVNLVELRARIEGNVLRLIDRQLLFSIEYDICKRILVKKHKSLFLKEEAFKKIISKVENTDWELLIEKCELKEMARTLINRNSFNQEQAKAMRLHLTQTSNAIDNRTDLRVRKMINDIIGQTASEQGNGATERQEV